jgi:hypothetical protein
MIGTEDWVASLRETGQNQHFILHEEHRRIRGVERETHLESMIEKRCGLESFYDQRVTCRAQGPWVTERRGCWISETVMPRHVDGVW